MKIRIVFLSLAILLVFLHCTPAIAGQESSEPILVLPASSSERSDALAQDLLDFGMAMEAPETAVLFDEAGFEVLLQQHYDKSTEDPSHTCAFTIGSGQVLRDSQESSALLIHIRGTADGEWYSNFDFCPSHAENPGFAENFLFCAEDVFLALKDFLDRKDPDTAVIITGVSRGGACACLLGLLVNEYISPEDVYVYSFATPNVINKDLDIADQDNIFNYINPADLVPKLPLQQWGFQRPGTDILLPQKDEELIEAAEQYAQMLSELAPTIADYYGNRHSLTAPGTDSFGLTPFELMMLLGGSIIESRQKIIYENGNLVWQGSYESSSGIPDTFLDSDYAELINALDPLFQINKGKTLKLLLQHMPVCYKQLIESMQES